MDRAAREPLPPKLLSLVEVANVDRDAEHLLAQCRQIFGHLRNLYKRDPEHPIPIIDFAVTVDVPADGVRKALPYLQRGLTFVAISGDLDTEAATVAISEQVLQYATFDDVLDQYRRWAQGPETPKSEGERGAARNAAQGSGSVVRNRTNAAIVIGIASAGRSQGGVAGPEVEDAQNMAEWFTTHGSVPARSLRLITSSIATDGTIVAPTVDVVARAFTELHEERSDWPRGTPLFSTRLYIFVAGAGFGDGKGGVSIYAANASDQARVGLELTRVVRQFTAERLFDEVVLFADVPDL